MKIFLAGATGAIGRRLVPLLLNARHYVIGTTRSTNKADGLRAAGVDPVVVDVFDAQALSAAVREPRIWSPRDSAQEFVASSHKALLGCMRRGRNHIPRMMRSISTLVGHARSRWQGLQRWNG